MSDPTVRLVDGDRGYLVADVHTTEMDAAMAGERAEQELARIPLVELDLAAARRSESGGSVTLTDVPTRLTSQGAEAFSNYEAGTEFDALSVTITPAADCGPSAQEAATRTTELVTDDHTAIPTWAWVAGGALLVLAGLGAGLVIGRRPGGR